MRPLLALALVPASASAQLVVPRAAPAFVPLGAPAAPLSAAAPAPAYAPPPLAAPTLAVSALSAAPLAAPALAVTAAVPAAASGPDQRPQPGPARAGDALAKGEGEFRRLVADLASGDREKSDAAAVALNKLKDAHLNADPSPEKTKVLGLKPMQIPAGMLEVQSKTEELRGMKSKDAEKWLKEKSVPYLEDYKGRKRPVDHHHEARAAWEAGQEQIHAHPYFDARMHGWIRALPKDQFYAVTRAMGLFYDRDQFGVGPHEPNHLPEDVRGMADDPFRSLAWAVRKKGGYEKTAVPFAEFRWAQYFRERLATYPTKADFDKAVAEALKLAHSEAAKDLPGWSAR